MKLKRDIQICTLQQWELLEIGVRRIKGKVYGHKTHIDGTVIIVDSIIKYSKAGSFAITKDTFYNLEEEKSYKSDKQKEIKEDD